MLFCNLFQLGITQFRKLNGFIMVAVFGFIVPCLLFLASLDFCNSINYITSLNYTNINDITKMKSKTKLIETQWDWFSNRHHTVLYIYTCCVLDTIYVCIWFYLVKVSFICTYSPLVLFLRVFYVSKLIIQFVHATIWLKYC